MLRFFFYIAKTFTTFFVKKITQKIQNADYQ